MSTSEQYTSPANSGRSRKRSLSPNLNMEDISSGSTFSQNIENIEGLTSLHADQQVFIVSIFFSNFLNVESCSIAYMVLRPIITCSTVLEMRPRSQFYLKIISGCESFFW